MVSKFGPRHPGFPVQSPLYWFNLCSGSQKLYLASDCIRCSLVVPDYLTKQTGLECANGLLSLLNIALILVLFANVAMKT